MSDCFWGAIAVLGYVRMCDRLLGDVEVRSLFGMLGMRSLLGDLWDAIAVWGCWGCDR